MFAHRLTPYIFLWFGGGRKEETSVPLLTSRSYPLSVEGARHRRRIFTIARAFLAVGYAIFALRGRHRPLTLGNSPTHEAPIKDSRRLDEQRLSWILCGCKPHHRCSNPSKCSDMLGKASKRKYSCLQVFCKLQKALAKCRAAFARRRSGVRIPSAPLLKVVICR